MAINPSSHSLEYRLCLQMAAKYLFVRALRGTRHLQDNTVVHWNTWLYVVSSLLNVDLGLTRVYCGGRGIVLGCVIFSFIIAASIPFFESLVGLIGALFGASLCLVLMGVMWFHMHPQFYVPFFRLLRLRRDRKSDDWKPTTFWSSSATKKLLFVLNLTVILVGSLCVVAGTYASAVSIRDSYSEGTVGSAFSCADNSNST
jgi:hypothetical protein